MIATRALMKTARAHDHADLPGGGKLYSSAGLAALNLRGPNGEPFSDDIPADYYALVGGRIEPVYELDDLEWLITLINRPWVLPFPPPKERRRILVKGEM